MYKVLVIDDEPLGRQLVINYLRDYPSIREITEATNGFEGIKKIQEENPDILFLDVQMPKVNGFELLELIDDPPYVIFTTAFDQYALQAFEAQAVDYLLKPIGRERLDQALQKCFQLLASPPAPREGAPQPPREVYEGYQHRLVVKENGLIRIIPASEIHYVEASDDYVRIHSAAGRFLKKSTLTRIEQSLDPNAFVRVHRSYLVAVSQITRIESFDRESHLALIRSGEKIPVSRAGMARLKQTLGW